MFRRLGKVLREIGREDNVSKTMKEWEKEWEAEKAWKKANPWKHVWRRTKWWGFGYWVKAFFVFKDCFKDDKPWYKCLWDYIYFENIIFSFFYKIYRKIDIFCYKVRKIYLWSKVLWNNHDWDWTCIWTTLRYQLERLEDACGKGHHSNKRNDASEIQYAIIMVARIQRYDNYREDGERDCPYEEEAKQTVDENDTMKMYAKQSELYEADIVRLWDYIAKNHRKWWD